jgi:hypothetical protein
MQLILQLVRDCIAYVKATVIHHHQAAAEARYHAGALGELLAVSDVAHHQAQEVLIHLGALLTHVEAVQAAGHPQPRLVARVRDLHRHHVTAIHRNLNTRATVLSLMNRHIATRQRYIQAVGPLEYQLVDFLRLQMDLRAHAQRAHPGLLI